MRSPLGSRSPIRKVLLPGDRAGESTEYWEAEWSGVDLDEAEHELRDAPGPVMRIIQEHLPVAGRILEAGCGAGPIAAALRSPDRQVVGMDLAGAALRRAVAHWADVGFVEGDVTRMPFRDGSFDAVVSLGVVEHLEAGPALALREQRRVLTPSGVLLISVPVINLAKWARDRWQLGLRGRSSYVARNRSVTWAPEVGPDRAMDAPFHQYEFPLRVWDSHLRAAGLEPIDHIRHLASAGVGEVPWLVGLASSSSPRPSAHGSGNDRSTSSTSSPSPSDPRLRRRLANDLIREEGTAGLDAALTAAGRYLFGHMVMTVARREVDSPVG